jgi:hypothetical protein
MNLPNYPMETVNYQLIQVNIWKIGLIEKHFLYGL